MLKLGILDVEGTKFHLKIGQEYTLGRKSNEYHHDIEIDDQTVDIKHSIIDLTQSSPQLFDVSSKNGTFVDGLKIDRFQSVSLSKSSKIRFGNVETYLQLLFEGDSGYLEERPNSPTKDTSEIICNSPELIAPSGSRLKNALKSSLTSTPNASPHAASLPSTAKPITNFLIPSCAPRNSKGSNTSARSSDSFYIPETQHPAESNSKTNNSTDISFYSNRSQKNSTVGDDDFFIPETQEVVSSAIPLQNHARLAFPSDDVNETISQEDRIPSSQFRICTQDFNGSEEDLSNHSGDILANVPFSLAIPTIQYETVQVNDFAYVAEDETDKEMSVLEWSKKTLEENANDSVTPDGLLDGVGSVTSDLMQGLRKSSEKALSQCSTPDIFANPEEPTTSNIKKSDEKEGTNIQKLVKEAESGKIKDEEVPIVPKEENNDVPQKVIEPEFQPTQVFVRPVPIRKSIEENVNLQTNDVSPQNVVEPEFQPTQVFVRPIPLRKSITIPSLPPVVENENNGPADISDILPATQVFSPPQIRPKPVVPSSSQKLQNIPITADAKLKSSGSGQNHVFAAPLPSPKYRASLNPPPPLVASNDDDDLPPTQVFIKEEEQVTTPIVSNVCFSSTLVDCEMQLSENSFKTKCNKLLDSDDDEMDEVIAPDLVKQMRQSLDKLAQPINQIIEEPLAPEEPSTSSKQTKDIAPEETPMITPERNNNFRIPVKAFKTNYSKTPALDIDSFMLTPDFLGKEFSKNTQLQKEAEVNWMNIVLEKQRQKPLFGDADEEDENLDCNSSGDSRDSFVDLLPKRREKRSKSVNRNLSEKLEKPKGDKEVVSGRITRRRTTTVGDVNKAAAEKVVAKKESKKRGRKRKDDSANSQEDSTNSEKNTQKTNFGEPKKREKKKKEDSTTSKEDSTDSEKITKKTNAIAESKEAEKSHDKSTNEFKDFGDSKNEKPRKEDRDLKNKKDVNNDKDLKADALKTESRSRCVVKVNMNDLVKGAGIAKDSSNVKEVVEDSRNEKARKGKDDLKTKTETKSASKNNTLEKQASVIREQIKCLLMDTNVESDSSLTKSTSFEKNSNLLKPSSLVNDSSLLKASSLVKDDKLSKNPTIVQKPKMVKEQIATKLEKPSKSSSRINASTIKEPSEVNKSSVPKEPSFTRRPSSTKLQTVVKEPSFVEATSVNKTKESPAKNESSKEAARTRRKTRQKVEEPVKVEEKSRAVKRNVEVTKTSSRASKINKLEGLDVTSKKNEEKPSPRITRLRSCSDLKVEDKKTTLKNQEEKKEAVKKEAAKKEAAKKEAAKKEAAKKEAAKKGATKKEEPIKNEAITKNHSLVDQIVDLTSTEIEDTNNKIIEAGTAQKRKSQEDESIIKRSKSMISGSQSSVDSCDSDRTLRRKAKIKIAISSCSPATRSTLVRYSGRIWIYTEDPKECDVLIMEAGNRTYKLLVAIARGVSVVKVNWLKEVIEMRSTDVPFDKHLFDEPNFQKRHQFVMRDVLQQARSKSLFLGMNFMMTPNITPKPDEMKDIIACAGGTVLTNIPTSQDIQPLYLVSENIDNNHWHKYRRGCPGIKIVTAIALMSSVMQQSLDALIKSIH